MSAYDAVDGAWPAALKRYRLVASKPERFKEVRPGDDVLTFWRNWRGHDDVMQSRSIRGSGEPAWVIASLNACLRLGPDPRRALWPAATSGGIIFSLRDGWPIALRIGLRRDRDSSRR